MSESFGASSLIRIAGLPIRYWLSMANPDLFNELRTLSAVEESGRARSVRLADTIGQRLVPNPGLTRSDRRFALSLRRKLHAGGQLADAEIGQLRTCTEDSVLLAEIDQAAQHAENATRLAVRIGQKIEAEPARLAAVLAVLQAESSLFARLTETVAFDRGGARQRRRRIEHAWRILARATTDSTPRNWFSHVAALTPDPTATELAISPGFATQWRSPVRSGLTDDQHYQDDWPSDLVELALNPLHWLEDVGTDQPRLACLGFAADGQRTTVAVRLTPLLDTIRGRLGTGPVTFAALAADVAGQTPAERAMLRAFVRHLIGLGIVQASRSTPARLCRAAIPERATPRAEQTGWLDVHRHSETGLAVPAGLLSAMKQTMRVLALLTDDSTAGQAMLPDSDWGPFTEILRAELALAEADPGSPPNESPRRVTSDLPAAGRRLISELSARPHQEAVLDIDAALLDRLGAPECPVDWPVDALLRLAAPSAGFEAVLERFWPAETIDSRFAEAFSELDGELGQVSAYRDFLRQLEELTDVRFVEVLAPPLSDGAANAVRRPAYTGAWTGDPHRGGYLPDGGTPADYLPLQTIQVRRRGGRLQAQVDGRRIWPVYHATRSFSPPWDRIGRLLLATAPHQSAVSLRSLDNSSELFPDREAVPRITVGGRLVIAPAQWWLPPNRLWDRDAPLAVRLRALIRLRDELGLPRWLRLHPAVDAKPVPCDLESTLAIHSLEQLVVGGPLRVSEMLPAPDQLRVIDRAHRRDDRVAAQVQLRLPVEQTPTQLAYRLAPRIRAGLGQRTGAGSRALTGTGSRAPPVRRALHHVINQPIFERQMS